MDVIDLTNTSSSASLSEQHSQMDDEIDNEEEMEVIGSCNAQVVGIRYYNGVAHQVSNILFLTTYLKA